MPRPPKRPVKRTAPASPKNAPSEIPFLEDFERRVSALHRMEEEFESDLSVPRVSVVIVNMDGVDDLWHCLFALRTQTRPPEEILVVDNQSTDTSVSFVRANYPEVRILECQEDFGYAMAANLGCRAALGGLVVLLENSAVPTPDWLSRMVG